MFLFQSRKFTGRVNSIVSTVFASSYQIHHHHRCRSRNHDGAHTKSFCDLGIRKCNFEKYIEELKVEDRPYRSEVCSINLGFVHMRVPLLIIPK